MQECLNHRTDPRHETGASPPTLFFTAASRPLHGLFTLLFTVSSRSSSRGQKKREKRREEEREELREEQRKSDNYKAEVN
jgi:hypothetical protein